MEQHSLITVLGWEDRFMNGVDIILDKYNVKSIVLILFKDYCSMDNMSINLDKIKSTAALSKISLTEIVLEYNNSINNWKVLNNFFKENEINNPLLNLTTIPRETIWTLLFYLRNSSNSVDYVYFKPKTYNNGWLTKNHKEPRLLFKHSGIFELEKKLVLFVITGFDESRLKQLIEYYEPYKLIIFSQSGEQFNNLTRNKSIPEFFDSEIEVVEMDTYNIKLSNEKLNEYIIKNIDFNIIIASQGPKTSSISTYKSYLDSSNRIGLAYVPARDFNGNYSVGIDEDYINGTINLN
tara:strand:- start:178 stop:1059 length:882 start_codon:yes stop_codon:yes gene_type:complete